MLLLPSEMSKVTLDLCHTAVVSVREQSLHIPLPRVDIHGSKFEEGLNILLDVNFNQCYKGVH